MAHAPESDPSSAPKRHAKGRFQALFEDPAQGILRAVVNAAVDGVVLIDTAGVIQSVNPAVERLFGYTPDELVGENVRILMPSPYREEHDGYIERYRATREPRIIGIGREVEGRRRDGSTFPLDLAVSEVRYGDEVFFLGTLRDISERVRLEAEIRQAQKMEAIGRLAGGVAHDFNTLLGTIRGYSEMLLSAMPEHETQRPHIEEIHRAALRGAQLTRQLLLFSRRQELKAQLVDLGKVLADLDVMLDRLIGEDIAVVRQIEPGIEKVWGDPGELHQLILNLVVNACDAMPSGGTLTLTLGRHRAAQDLAVEGRRLPPGNYALLEVSDTGVGMTEEVRRRVFEPFFTTKEPGKGTGLGLSTVHAIVGRVRGGIAVETHLGRGANFRVYMPLAGDAGSSEAEAAAVPEPTAAPAEVAGTETILLVEDDDMFRGLLELVLRRQGYLVLAAANPAAALALVEAHGHDVRLMLSDMVMPGGTGADLAVELGASFPEMKLVLMSGYTDDALASRAADHSVADAFLQKPFATDELLRLVRTLLGATA